MSARKRIFKEDILSAGIRVIQKHGAEALTVRNIAGELGCSTQPIYSEFRNLDALKAALLPTRKKNICGFLSQTISRLRWRFWNLPKRKRNCSNFCICASAKRRKDY